jgi:Protein of unknown function (DUF3500)
MRLLPRLLSVLAVLALTVSTAFGHGASEEMSKAANAFLGSLDDAQRAKATFAFDNAERTNWIFVPAVRKGLPIKEMNPGQRHFAQALLSVSLSQRGHMKVESIMALEYLLFVIEEGKGANKRDAEKYSVSIFGQPAHRILPSSTASSSARRLRSSAPTRAKSRRRPSTSVQRTLAS